MSRPPLRIALIGCGAIAELGHAPAFLTLGGDATVTAVVDLAPARRQLLGDMLSVHPGRRYDNVDTLLDDPEPIDLAVVVLPPDRTPPVVERLLAADIRVLCEKPMSVDVGVAARLAGLAPPDRLGIVHNYLYRSDVRQAIRQVRAGTLGRIRFLRLEQPDPGHFPGAGVSPYWRRRHAGGGCLTDNAYHWMYVAAELANSPVVRVTARLSRPDVTSAEDVAMVLLDHESGTLTSVQTAWCAPRAQPVLEVHAQHGSLRLEGDCGACQVYPDPGPARSEPVEPSYAAMFREVFAAVRAGQPFAAPADACVGVLTVLRAATQSARQGRTVPVETAIATSPGAPPPTPLPRPA
ncbi:Gfo/Idh/MocA family oxidoreductase [Actinoplanes sp. NPDC026670]|uniref:Gfo/Idh/MocA family protein n=1 Tax=Actinoplanes sp. NPDC026670 TaxID=3154700 RepID=UPI0033C1E3B2